jgi:hypothetical protein
VSFQGNAGGNDQSPASLKSIMPPESRVPRKLTVPPANSASSKRTVPPENSALSKTAIPDDRVAHFTDGLEGQSLLFGSVLAGIGRVGHAQIGAQHIDASLPVFLPVISQAGHGVHPR